MLGPDHLSTLKSLENLGLVYHKQGRRMEAENTYQEALVGEERTFGHDSIRILEVSRRLGEVWKAQGRSQESARSVEASESSTQGMSKDESSTREHNLGGKLVT